MTRLAVVTTHPVQYYAPWFRYLAAQSGLDVRVFYLWDFGTTDQVDPAFGVRVTWDIPILEGYPHEFVPNRSRYPGTERFWGIDNPTLRERLRQFAPDAALCIGYNYATFAKLVFSRRPYPLILRGDSHRLVPQIGWKARAKRAILTRVFRRFAACLYVGQANREYYQLHGVPEERLFFCPHAVDNDRFTGTREDAEADAVVWRAELGIPADHRVILFAGKFESKKRPLDLLEAFKRSALARAALLFVGSGPLEADLRRAAVGVPGVFFAPFQNQTKMPRTYASADLVVLPSYGPSETWGLCVNEAMCLGRAVIVSSHVGCGPDLVPTSETGAIFPAGDVGVLANQLREALSDGNALAARGRAGADRIRLYSYEHTTNGLLQCLAWLEGVRTGSTDSGKTIGRQE